MTTKNGFTPVSDYLAWKYKDNQLAMVYGAVERFAAMGKTDYCNASVETLAERAVCSTATVKNKLLILERDGYLVDLSPRGDKNSHRRIVTDKLGKEERMFWAFADAYLEDKAIKDYYEAFTAFAERMNLEPFITIVNAPKKSRGIKKGQKIVRNGQPLSDAPLSENCTPMDNDYPSMDNDYPSYGQPLSIGWITITQEDTTETTETSMETMAYETFVSPADVLFQEDDKEASYDIDDITEVYGSEEVRIETPSLNPFEQMYMMEKQGMKFYLSSAEKEEYQQWKESQS